MNQLWDDLGEYVGLSGIPHRVVSLVPSITETIAVSAPQVLVGATDYCVHPEALEVVRVGGSKYPRVDDVLALQPDLVVANAEENRPEDVNRLRANGVPVWVTAAPATVPRALASLRRLLLQALGVTEPRWLNTADSLWRATPPVRTTAIIPVWRRPWIVLGRDTFAGDVLRRLGVANAYAQHTERYPRPTLDELRSQLIENHAELVVLPDEPYAFSDHDGPEAFPGANCIVVSGRYLTWYGPSLVQAHTILAQALS